MAKAGKNAPPAGPGKEGQNQPQAGRSDAPKSESGDKSTAQAAAASNVAGQEMAGSTKIAEKQSSKSGGAVDYVCVVSKSEGFRRGGRAWTRKPQAVPASEFTQEQIDQILADPELFAGVREMTPEQAAAVEAGE